MPLHLANFPDGQFVQHERAITKPDQPADLKPQMFEDAADLAILAFAQRHLDPDIGARPPLQIGVDLAVADAVNLNSVDQFLQLRLTDLAICPGAIGALDTGRGQFQLALEPPVRGQQQQPLGIEVEPPHGHQSRQSGRQAIIDGRPPLGIALGDEQAVGLVVQEQPGRFGRRHGLAVDGHAVERGQKCRGSVDRHAIQRDPPVRDHPLDLATRRHAGPRKQFGYTLI